MTVKKTKLLVVGGGTAGFMAAAHLSRHFPQIELTQVIDPLIPTIGVGEGTTAGFRRWLDDIAPVSFDVLQRDLHATVKRGVKYENWGRTNQVYYNDFVPTESTGLHLSAGLLVDFLRRHVRGNIIEGHVTSLVGSDEGVTVELADATRIAVDVAVDARGFPKELNDDHVSVSWIPTNAALVTRAPVVRDIGRSRAIARPHGWIFVIPLSVDTAFGYVFSTRAAGEEEIRNDFAAFLKDEGVDTAPPRRIDFPNFLCREPFRNRVLKIGNAASFLEPLEATAIAIYRYQLNFLSAWLDALQAGSDRIANHLVDEMNRLMVELVQEVSLFVGWHYSVGSPYDTLFWRKARKDFDIGLNQFVPAPVRSRFLAMIDYASRLPQMDVSQIRTAADLDRMLPEHRSFPPPFGGMTPLGFAQVGRGLGAI